ncbi:insulin gene enhancer protein ISL-1 isoform X2 [Dermacentor andersoni]|uniref:insulin gene enhancer protein ISL-1 isoform X2 n=1 Tax=Dermacentor andersoni TaxID=34620 RepID=UPI0021554114|nr:insulin gene enhancer protein ISL-1-like isoform X2 [Dermacentor andersoni]
MTEAVPQLCVSASDKAASGGGGGCRSRRVCAGCGAPIRDQYILRVAPDLEWHAACLKCADCHQFLDETCTCFVRDGKTYCKRDYVRLFGTKCSKCRLGFCRTDFVMRARQHVYHLNCFRCQACERQLMPGDEFALREDGLFCRADHDVLDKFASSAHGAPPANGIHVAPNAEPVPVGGGVPGSRSGGQAGAAAAPPAQPRGHPQSKQQPQHAEGQQASQQHKPTRVRTVLNEKQLHTLRTCYAANPRPDALMKEQLVEMTGLSPRVIRVWFQNKRCKDKKKSLLMKQMQQHEKMHGYDTGDPGCMGVLPLGAGGHYLCPDDGLVAPPSNLSSHHSSHLPGTPSELSSPTSE